MRKRKERVFSQVHTSCE